MKYSPDAIELAARLTEMREDYRTMSTGHAGLGGFNIAIACRADAAIERLLPRPKPVAPAATPDQQPRITEDCA